MFLFKQKQIKTLKWDEGSLLNNAYNIIELDGQIQAIDNQLDDELSKCVKDINCNRDNIRDRVGLLELHKNQLEQDFATNVNSGNSILKQIKNTGFWLPK